MHKILRNSILIFAHALWRLRYIKLRNLFCSGFVSRHLRTRSLFLIGHSDAIVDSFESIIYHRILFKLFLLNLTFIFRRR